MKKYNILIVLFLFIVIAGISACSNSQIIRPATGDKKAIERNREQASHEKSDSAPGKKAEFFKEEYSPAEKDLSCSEFVFRDSRIKLRKTELSDFHEFDGPVVSVFSTDSRLFYIRFEEGDSQPGTGRRGQSILGCIDQNEKKILYEKNLPVDVFGPGVKKFFVSGNTASVLCGNTVYYSIDILTMNVRVTEGVLDAVFNNGDPLLLRKDDSGSSLVSRAGSVLLSISGPLTVDWLIHNRLAIICGNQDTEVVDIVQMKSLTVYSATRKFRRPDQHNVVISMKDQTEICSDKEMIYYRIFVNGFEKGRTETGPPAVEHRAFLNLDVNKLQLIRLERWKLSHRKNMYIRENNVMQPDVMKMQVEENRVILLEGIYNGKDYSFGKKLAVE